MKIPSNITCSTCRITLDTILMAASQPAAGLSGSLRAAARGPQGNVFLTASSAPYEVLEFDGQGRLAGRVGRRGEGRGEFGSIKIMRVDASGLLHVFDPPMARETIFGPGLTLINARGLAAELLHDAIVLPSGNVVLNALYLDRDDAGYALVEYDSQGAVVRRFDESSFRASQPWWHERNLSVSSNGRLIVSHVHQYIIDVYRADGGLERRVTRDADWFQGPTTDANDLSDGLLDKPPLARVAHAWQDEAGLLWAVTFVRSPRWRPVSRADLGNDRSRWSDALGRPRYETIVEVLDASAGRVVARRSFEELVGLWGDGLLFGQRQTEDGNWVPILSRLTLTKPQERTPRAS